MGKRSREWKTQRFDEMAVMVRDKIDNPAEADVDRYVGLEHLDSDSLKIRRWGVPTDVEATKLCFKDGDIIFGRRRVYQRKLAVADFDGICSAHAMVLRPKPETVLPEFLPFFMQSDLFMDRALEISVGSLSPTINWKTLAKQEFALPPLEEQRRIAQVLRAAEKTHNEFLTPQTGCQSVYRALCKDHFIADRKERASTSLGEVAEIRNGTTPRRSREDYWGGDVPWVSSGKVHERRICAADEFVTKKALDECSLRMIPAGSTLVAMIGEGITRGHSAFLEIDSTINQNVAAVTPSEKIDPEFLFHQLDSLYEALRHWSQGSNHHALNCRLVAAFPVWVPDMSLQQEVIQDLGSMARAEAAAEARAKEASQIKSQLMRKTFGEHP